jgi:predicted RNase H-like nuclease (RuvC/YqgF family)
LDGKNSKITQLQTEIEHLKAELDGKNTKIDILDKRLSCVEDELQLQKEIC